VQAFSELVFVYWEIIKMEIKRNQTEEIIIRKSGIYIEKKIIGFLFIGFYLEYYEENISLTTF
jgi:hypothetical protein